MTATKCLLLDKCGDLKIENGRLVISDGVDKIRQNWLIKIRKVLGEWVLNELDGVDYYKEVFVKNPNLTRVKEIFKQATLAVQGVERVNSIEIGTIDAKNRTVQITVDATVNGEQSNIFQYDGTLGTGDCMLTYRYWQSTVGGDPIIQSTVGGDPIVQSTPGGGTW